MVFDRTTKMDDDEGSKDSSISTESQKTRANIMSQTTLKQRRLES